MLHMIVDGQWGSTGKGWASTALVLRAGIRDAVTQNGPNSGHTAVITHNGQRLKFVGKVLPACALVLRDPAVVWIGPAAVVDPAQLEKEYREVNELRHQQGLRLLRVIIHPQAALLDRTSPAGGSFAEHMLVERIGSTGQGTLGGIVNKLARGTHGPATFGEHRWVGAGDVFVMPDSDVWRDELADVCQDTDVIFEGCQGTHLSIDHGPYPFTTSRNCTAPAFFESLGLPPAVLGRVFLTVRTYPIRVGGNSGPAWNETQAEITWAEVAARLGSSEDMTEFTTVTKRVRRVFEFSLGQVTESVRLNGATDIIWTFANHCEKSRRLEFAEDLKSLGLRIPLIGHGADSNESEWPMSGNPFTTCYVAAPYRAETPELQSRRYDRAMQVARVVQTAGLVPVLPHNMSIGLRPERHDWWLPASCAMMERCHMVLATGISEGVQREAASALNHHQPMINPNTNIDDLSVSDWGLERVRVSLAAFLDCNRLLVS